MCIPHDSHLLTMKPQTGNRTIDNIAEGGWNARRLQSNGHENHTCMPSMLDRDGRFLVRDR